MKESGTEGQTKHRKDHRKKALKQGREAQEKGKPLTIDEVVNGIEDHADRPLSIDEVSGYEKERIAESSSLGWIHDLLDE